MNGSSHSHYFSGHLLLPLGMYVLLSALYLVTVPSGESPDEPGHLQCIEQVSNEIRLPQYAKPSPGQWWARETVISDRMCYHMPLYYVISGTVQRGVAMTLGGTLDYQFPASNPREPDPSMFLHLEEGLFPGMGEPATVTSVRLISILMGFVMIISTHRFAHLIFPAQDKIALGASVLLAGWPQFIFMSRAISNDLLAAMLAVIVLTILIDVGKPQRFIIAMLVAILAVLSKMTTAFVVAIVIGVFAIEIFVYREKRASYFKSGIWALIILIATITFLLIQPTLRNDFLITSTSFDNLSQSAVSVRYWLDVLLQSMRSSVAYFGWMSLPAPDPAIIVWWLIIGSGLVVGIWKLLTTISGKDNRLKWIIIVLWVIGILATYLRINLNRFQPQFRFILSLLPILTTLTSFGFYSIFKRFEIIQKRFVVILAVILIGLNIWLVFYVISPAYRFT